MSKVDEVRSALHPLIDQGIVTDVLTGGQPLSDAGDPPLAGEPAAVDIIVRDGADHELYRLEIGERVAKAGVTGVKLVLRPGPPRV